MRNEEECVCSVCVKFLCNIPFSGKIIKELPGSVASGTCCSIQTCLKHFNFINYKPGFINVDCM